MRGAAAVALGQVKDAMRCRRSRVRFRDGYGLRLLQPPAAAPGREDEFVPATAAVSLGQIGSARAVPVLV